MNGRYEGEISISPRAWECKPDGHGKVTAYQEVIDDQQDKVASWTYEGAFVNGRITGEGTTTYGDPYPDGPDLAGQVYIGAHVNGKAHGQGTWHYRGGAVQYVGDNQNGEFHGQGTSYRQDGNTREDGTRENGTREYEGAWEKSLAHGEGTWYYPDGAVQYVGDNQNGEFYGQGTSYRQDGNTREDGTRENGTREYEGTWQGSCWIGNGTLYRPDGTISRNGEWVNGGSEEYEWQGETCWYEGDWDKEGPPHGWGILYRPDRISVEREGWWQNGEPVDGPRRAIPMRRKFAGDGSPSCVAPEGNEALGEVDAVKFAVEEVRAVRRRSG